jgi:hypothetical protein
VIQKAAHTLLLFHEIHLFKVRYLVEVGGFAKRKEGVCAPTGYGVGTDRRTIQPSTIIGSTPTPHSFLNQTYLTRNRIHWIENDFPYLPRSCLATSRQRFISEWDVTMNLTFVSYPSRSRDSSVGIALCCGLDDGGSRVRLPAGAGNFSLHHRVQNGSGAHPASYIMGNRGSYPGGKAAGA